MEPFCIGSICVDLGLELGGLLLAAVAGVATVLHHRHQKAHHHQQEQHHQEMRALHERSLSEPGGLLPEAR